MLHTDKNQSTGLQVQMNWLVSKYSIIDLIFAKNNDTIFSSRNPVGN